MMDDESSPSDLVKKIMDATLVLHGEHTINASTFTAMVTSSTLANPSQVIASAIGSLAGPLHGGANQKVVKMLDEIGSVSNVKDWLNKTLEKKQIVWGMGHREYSVKDPRANILTDLVKELFEEKSGQVSNMFETAMELEKQCEDFKKIIYKPLENYTVGRNEITGGTVSPSYILPIQGLQRLQKIMDEYVGGIATNYMTNANMLKRGLELLEWLQEDLENVGAEDYHQLMRAWELKHRALTSQCVTEHTMFREETRWPGYYYRGDHLKLDDENWHCLTVSRRDPKTGKFTLEKVPVYHIVDEKEKKQAS